MRAHYALALSKLFAAIRGGETSEDIRMMYNFVYAKIYACIRKGETRTMMPVPMTHHMIAMLTADGFLVMTHDGKVYIDWTIPWKPSAVAPKAETIVDGQVEIVDEVPSLADQS